MCHYLYCMCKTESREEANPTSDIITKLSGLAWRFFTGLKVVGTTQLIVHEIMLWLSVGFKLQMHL